MDPYHYGNQKMGIVITCDAMQSVVMPQYIICLSVTLRYAFHTV